MTQSIDLSNSGATGVKRPGSARRRVVAVPWGRHGLRLTATLYLGLLVALPIGILIRRGATLGASSLWHALTHPVVRSAIFLTLETAVLMTAINAVMGTLIAYVLVRYRFLGRTFLNLVIDLPFAIPTLVTGLMIVALLGPASAMGHFFASLGIKVVYAPPSIVLALLFVTLPFVVRAVQPVLMELDVAEEEAAYTLGASEWMTFREILLPALLPAITTGSLLSYARALGEFGSIVVVAGNIPRRTMTAAVYVFGEIESGSPETASAMSLVLIAISFVTILLVDALERRRKRGEHAT